MHLSTIHKIKGREWEHVIVYGASKGLFPHRLSDDEEGERRVFHVALTRAIRQVLVLADAQEPSPFVAELDGSRAHTAVLRARREARATRSRRRAARPPCCGRLAVNLRRVGAAHGAAPHVRARPHRRGGRHRADARAWWPCGDGG